MLASPLPRLTRQHYPMLFAAWFLIADMLSTLVFAGLYGLTRNVALAVAAGVACGVAGIGWALWRGRRPDALQWMTLGLVAVFGTAALMTDNPLFIMLKPTLIYAAVGCVMLRPGWMLRYMPPLGVSYGADVIAIFGRLWAGLFLAMACANAALALLGSHAAWVWFIATVPLAAKIALFVLQCVTTRLVVRARVRRAAHPALQAAL